MREIKTITPGVAADLLATSRGNRKIRKDRVKAYARDMKVGKWYINGNNAILLDKENRLCDGHHRLLAVIEAGMAVDMAIEDNISDEAIKTLDIGGVRTITDAINIKSKGVKYSTVIGASLSYLVALRRSNVFVLQSNLSRFDLEDIYDNEGEGLEKASEVISPLKPFLFGFTAAHLIAVYHYLTQDLHYECEFVKGFFYDLLSYKSSEHSSIELLRCRMLQDKGSKTKLKRDEKHYLLVKSFNGYVNGEEKKVLKYDRRFEAPAFIINDRLCFNK